MYGFVRAEHLNIWASRYTAPAEFPRLMRLLVWALVRAPRSVNFPADEAVRLALKEFELLELLLRHRDVRGCGYYAATGADIENAMHQAE